MELIFLVVGAAALIILWQRLKSVEQQLDTLKYRLEERGTAAQTSTVAAPVEPQAEDIETTDGADTPVVARASGVTIVKRNTEPEETISAEPAEPALIEDALSEIPETEPAMATSAPVDQAPAKKANFFDRFSFDFEELVGRRLSIWAGGIALAISGIFLVIYSIEQGLLSPTVRVALSFLFGFALLAAAELAHRFEERLADPRVRQALAGAGLATLYAAFYLAGTTYGLIGAGVAFAGLAGVTAGAIALSYRYGLPCAILGLVGGFAAPALVSSAEPNIPLLTIYLGLVTAGLAYTCERQSRPWLGIASLAGGFLWGTVLLASGVEGNSAIASVGLLIVGLGALIPLLLSSLSNRPWQRLAAAAIASLQMAALVFDGGFAPLTWGLYLLLAAALAFLSWRNPAMREANGVVAAVGVSLLLLWPEPVAREFAMVATAIAVIALLVPLVLTLRKEERGFDLWQIAVGTPALAFAAWHQFAFAMEGNTKWLLASAVGILAAIPALAAWQIWRRDDHPINATVATLASTAAVAFGGAMIALAPQFYPFAAAPIAGVLIYLWTRKQEGPPRDLAWFGALIAAFSVFADETNVFDEIARGFGEDYHPLSIVGALRWIAAIAPAAAMAWLDESARRRAIGETAAALFAYLALAQVLPENTLAWSAALLAIAAAWQLSERRALSNTFAVIAGLWALIPSLDWLEDGVDAMVGEPMLAVDLPYASDVVIQLAPFAVAALWIAMMRGDHHAWNRRIFMGLGGLASVVGLHALYKQIFALETITQFVDLGLLERTIWQAGLLAAGSALAHFVKRDDARLIGTALVGLSLAHFTIFTFILHNPLWAEQAVGQVPIANLALAAYAVALVGLYQLSRIGGEWLGRGRIAVEPIAMTLIFMLALTLLRQIFAGSIMPPVPMSGTEDLLRSLLGIVVAIGFLAWGAKTGKRSWRIGSMVLMVLAVAKVFLIDAAGLEGLLRIASFMALGFSLIGIGWVYSRLLGSGKKPKAEQAVS